MPLETCPKCGSGDILGNVDVSDSDGARVRLRRYKRPGQILFPGPMHTDLRAWVCRSCGYTEFYACRPEDLGEPRRGDLEE
jgi:ribosomal protein S27AE